MTAKRAKQADPKTQTPLLERVLGGIGLVLLIACVAFLVREGLSSDEHPGKLDATVKEILATADGHIVTFTLLNNGSQTLSNLRVSARLMSGEREVERADTVIDYLPGRSSQEGGFYLREDPRRYRLEIRPEGYQKP